MAIYDGQPIFANGITLADDGVPPQAGEINPGVEACWDAALWLKRELSRAFSRFSAKNFLNSNFAAATKTNPSDLPNALTKILALAASDYYFYITVRDGDSPDFSTFVRTRDGIGWGVRASVSLPIANNREHAAIAARPSATTDVQEWIIAGHSARGSGGAGQRIDVVNPAGTVNTATRGALSALTNYSAACFAGDRAYMFGAQPTFDGVAVPGNSGRVVSATLAGNFLDWANATGGILGGTLQSAAFWRCAVLGNIVVAVCGSGSGATDEYVRVDATTNVVTQPTLPNVGSDQLNTNVVVWNGKFWVGKIDLLTGTGTNLYSSTDGAQWVLESTVPGIIAMLVAEQSTLLAFENFNPIASTGDGSFQTVDGITWERTALSTMLITTARTASTKLRSAFLRFPDYSYAQLPANLRISLGGLL